MANVIYEANGAERSSKKTKLKKISSMVPPSKQLTIKDAFGIIDCFCN